MVWKNSITDVKAVGYWYLEEVSQRSPARAVIPILRLTLASPEYTPS